MMRHLARPAARHVTLALAAAVLAGCAGQVTAIQACRAEHVAELPARLVHNQLVVPVRLDGHPLDLLVDTGSEGSMVTPEAAEQIGLRRDPQRTTTIHGTGGTVVSANAEVRRFEVGALALYDQSLAVGPVPSAASTGVAGLLGADWLAGYDIDLDVPHHRLGLWRVSGCGKEFDPLSGRHFALPLIRTPRGRVLVPIVVNGTGMLAYLDSGAAATVITGAAATHLGIPRAVLGMDPGGFGLGVDLRRLDFRWHRFDEVRVGPERFRDIKLPVSDLQISVAGALLGADYLNHHRIWVSQSTRRLLVQPVR